MARPDGRAPTADATARLLCTLALLPYIFSFVTLPDIRLPTSGPQSCTCSVDKHTMSGPDKCPACSAAFLIFTIGAITIHDYMLTRIAIFVFFSPNIPHNSRAVRTTMFRERENGEHCLGGQRFERMSFSDGMGGMEAVLSEPECQCNLQWPWEQMVQGQRRRRGGEGTGSPSLTTRNNMEPAIETWWSTMAKGKAQGFCQLNWFVRLFITHLPRFLHTSIILVWYYFFFL